MAHDVPPLTSELLDTETSIGVHPGTELTNT